MKAISMPGLVWVDVFSERCPLTGGPVTDDRVTVEIVGLGVQPMSLVLGWSPKAGCHLAVVDSLLQIAERAGRPVHAAQAFRIDGREVEAAIYLSEPGLAVPWRTFVDKMSEATQALRPADPAEIRRLPRLDETWELAAREGEPVSVDGKLRPSQMMVVLEPGGLVRAAAIESGALRAAHLAAAVYQATAARSEDELAEGRPARVVFADASLAAPLRRQLKKAGIALTVGPTLQADAAIEDLVRTVSRGGGIEQPLLDDVSDDDLGALLDAARAFYDAAPWTRLRGDRYLAFRLDDGPWLYANVMGQAEEEHGIALFDDWLGLCRFVSAVPAPGESAVEALDEMGAAEGLTLYPLGVLHETDAERLAAAGPPILDGMYPVASRFTAQGGIGPSAWPSAIYTALMEALPGVIAKRRAATITSIKAEVETTAGRLTLRYPADGTEALTGREPDVELVVEPVDHGDEFMPMTPLHDQGLRVVGPAATRMSQADRAVRQALRWGFVRMVEMDGHAVWFGDSYAADPAPTLDDLAGARSVRVMFGAEMHPATVRRLAEPVGEVRAQLVDG